MSNPGTPTGFRIDLLGHTKEMRATTPEQVRNALGEGLERLLGVDEEVDFTMEVRRTYD